MSEVDLSTIKSDLAEIKAALLGNEYNKEGYLRRIDKLERKVEKIYIRIIFYTGVGTGTWFFLSYIIAKLLK